MWAAERNQLNSATLRCGLESGHRAQTVWPGDWPERWADSPRSPPDRIPYNVPPRSVPLSPGEPGTAGSCTLYSGLPLFLRSSAPPTDYIKQETMTHYPVTFVWSFVGRPFVGRTSDRRPSDRRPFVGRVRHPCLHNGMYFSKIKALSELTRHIGHGAAHNYRTSLKKSSKR
jgi:hypothetical protein